MSHRPKFALAVLIAAACLLIVENTAGRRDASAQQTAVRASIATYPLELHRGFIRGPSFSVAGSERFPLRSGLLAFSNEYKAALHRHPEALERARSSHMWYAAGVLGLAGVAGMSIKFLVDAISDVDALNAGELPDISPSTADWIGLGAFGLVGTVGNIGGYQRLRSAVNMYNRLETTPDHGGSSALPAPFRAALPFRLDFGVEPLTQQLHVGFNLRLGW
jgi:hypothetical protein